MDKQERYVILDLDNCIADDEWRLPAIEWEHTDFFQRFHEYHLHAAKDRLCNSHLFSASPPLVIITGRPFAYWKLTVRWLQRHLIPYVGLYMRPNNGCHLPAPDVKRYLLHRFFASAHVTADHIVCAYDDRADVVAMYREEGVTAQRVFITERIMRDEQAR